MNLKFFITDENDLSLKQAKELIELVGHKKARRMVKSARNSCKGNNAYWHKWNGILFLINKLLNSPKQK